MSIITQKIVSILTVLIMVFPWSTTLQSLYQQLTYPGKEAITVNIIEAVKSKDIAAIEDMMSESKKQSIEDLSGKIGTMIDMIDGEIIDARWYGGAGETVTNDYGGQISEAGWQIKFETAETVYILTINWVSIDTASPNRVGLSCLMLSEVVDESGGTNRLMLIQ